MARGVARALALGFMPSVLSGNATPFQVRPVEPPATYADRVSTNASIGRYEALYGSQQFRALDDESAQPWPVRTAIRTIGRLEETPGRGKSGEASPGLFGGGGESSFRSRRYGVCSTGPPLRGWGKAWRSSERSTN